MAALHRAVALAEVDDVAMAVAEHLHLDVPRLDDGAGVVTTRGDVHWVVTEYGAVNLHGLSARERAMALISIAHPKFRPWLLAEAKGQVLSEKGA